MSRARISQATSSMNQFTVDPAMTTYHQVRFRFHPERAKVWRVLCGYLQPWVDPAGTLLDMGAGYGEFSRFITASGGKWALDLNPELIGYWPENVRPIIQSATDPLPLPDSGLTTVFSSNLLEHFTTEDGAKILHEIRRVLKRQGRLIIVQPNFRLEPGRYFDDYTHKTPYTDNGFRDLVKASGFEVIHCEPRFTPLTMQSSWPKAEWMTRIYLALPYRPLAGQFMVVAEKP